MDETSVRAGLGLSSLAAFAWPAALVLIALFVIVAAMIVLAGRRDPELASRALQAALVGQTIARLVVLLMAVPLIGILGMGAQVDRTAAIAALAGIAGSAIGSAVGARLPAPTAK